MDLRIDISIKQRCWFPNGYLKICYYRPSIKARGSDVAWGQVQCVSQHPPKTGPVLSDRIYIRTHFEQSPKGQLLSTNQITAFKFFLINNSYLKTLLKLQSLSARLKLDFMKHLLYQVNILINLLPHDYHADGHIFGWLLSFTVLCKIVVISLTTLLFGNKRQCSIVSELS